MDWAFWVGITIFAGTIGGMFWMRSHPPVDEHGRRIPSLDRSTRAVLDELLDDDAPRSAYELRRRVRLTPERFNDLTGRMIIDGLIKWRPAHDVLGNPNVAPHGRYELTEAGIARALGLGRAVGRGRYRA